MGSRRQAEVKTGPPVRSAVLQVSIVEAGENASDTQSYAKAVGLSWVDAGHRRVEETVEEFRRYPAPVVRYLDAGHVSVVKPGDRQSVAAMDHRIVDQDAENLAEAGAVH